MKQFFRSLQFQPITQLTTLGVLVSSFVLLLSAVLVQQNLTALLSHWGREVKVDVYLKNGASDAQTGALKNLFRRSGLFSKITYFSKAQAEASFKKRMGNYLPGLLDDLGSDNPLPASFQLEVKSGMETQFDYSKLVRFAGMLKKHAGVDDVSYGQGWLKNYTSVLHVFSISIIAVLFIMLTGSLFVIGNSIGSSIMQRRDEIEILELFGATSEMIIKPYVVEGLILGFVSVVFAIIVTYFLYSWQVRMINHSMTFWSLPSTFEFLSWPRIAFAIVIGTSLGGLGAFVWTRKVTTGWSAAES